jgi:hypothetical protein
MYKVTNKNNMPLCECDTLDDSMKFARSWAGFVTIQGPDFAPILFEDVIARITAEGGVIGFRSGNSPTM